MTTYARWLPAAAALGFAIFGALTLWSAKRPAPAGPSATPPAPPAAKSNAVPATVPATTPAAPPANAAARPALKLPLRLGVVGDSGSSSYSMRNWSMMPTPPLSWVDLMVESGCGEFGAKLPATAGQNAGGYARAWSGYGFSTADVIEHKLELEAARALAAGEVDAVIVAIGHDDFKMLLAARALKKQVSPTEVEAMLAGFEQRYNTILDRLVAAKRGVVIVHTLIDWYRLPFVGMMSLSALEYQRLADATERANQIITAAASQRQLPLVDLRGQFAKLLASRPRLNGIIIETGTTGSEARFFFLPDGIHFGTVASAGLLNGLLASWGPILGVTLPPLADADIVRLSGLRAPVMREPRVAAPEPAAGDPPPPAGDAP